MAQIVLKIETNEGTDVLISFTADKIVNNVSTEIGATTTENNGVNGKSFAIGHLSLSDGYLGGQDTKLQSEVNKYNGFMFGATDSNGDYELTLSIEGTNIDKVIIVGDKNANQFPTKAILDEGTDYEKIIYSDDYLWAIVFMQEANSHTIKFTHWNRANYNACFTTLKILDKYLYLDKGNISNFSTILETSLNEQDIPAKIISKTGDCLIYDINNEIEDYIIDGIIPNKDIKVEYYINDNKVETQNIENIEYNINERTLSYQAKDFLSKLKNYNVQSIIRGCLVKNLYAPGHTSAYKIFEIALGFLGYSESDVESIFTEHIEFINPDTEEIWFSGTISDYLKEIVFSRILFFNQNVYELINKLCEVTLLTLIEDENGKLKAYSSLPLSKSNNEIIKINKYNMFSAPLKNIIPNNNIENVKIQSKSINFMSMFDNIEEETLKTLIENEKEDFLFISSNLSSFDELGENYHIDTVSNGYDKYVIGYYKGNVISNNDKFDYIPVLTGIGYGNVVVVNSAYCKGILTKKSGTFLKSTTTKEFTQQPTFLSQFNNYDDFYKYVINNIPSQGGSFSGYAGVSKLMAANEEKLFFFAFRTEIFQNDLGEMVELLKSTNVSFFYGLAKWFTVKLVDFGDKNYGNLSPETNKKFEISNNEFARIDANVFLNTSLPDFISKMILYYYKDIRQTIDINLFLTNYYNLSNELKIDYHNGEILKCKDNIKLEGDNNIYSIYHRKLSYNNGAPVMNIKAIKVGEIYDNSEIIIDMIYKENTSELINQEIQIAKDELKFEDYVNISYNNKILDENENLTKASIGDVLIFTKKPLVMAGHLSLEMKNIKINGTDYTFGDEYVIDCRTKVINISCNISVIAYVESV